MTAKRRPSRPTACGARFSFGIIAHGGVGSPRAYSPACKLACEAGYTRLRDGEHALEAVVETVRLLEDDGRFNAGVGSTLRLDGKTVEMDAAVMDCQGRMGSVLAVRDVKNPILAARHVLDTPHVALAGEGARLFSRLHNLPSFDKVSATSLRRYQKLRRVIREGRLGQDDERWNHRHLQSLWNFDVPYRDIFSHDTVGAVAVDREGRFAAAVSTGGASPMLLGRVGDVPFVGCGYYAGGAGAVAVTGIGEEIVRKMLSKAIYDRISGGAELRRVCRETLALFPGNIPIGIIAITRNQYMTVSNRKMPSARFIVRDGCSLPNSPNPVSAQLMP